jgi:hypothetical protein
VVSMVTVPMVGDGVSVLIDLMSPACTDSQYGMFVILLPLAISPALIVLLVGDRRAKRLGALSLASSSYARRQYLASHDAERENRTFLQSCLHYWSRLNGFGFLLMGFAFVLLLAPMTLNTTAKGGYTNREYKPLIEKTLTFSLAHCHAGDWRYFVHRLGSLGRFLCQVPDHAQAGLKPNFRMSRPRNPNHRSQLTYSSPASLSTSSTFSPAIWSTLTSRHGLG